MTTQGVSFQSHLLTSLIPYSTSSWAGQWKAGPSHTKRHVHRVTHKLKRLGTKTYLPAQETLFWKTMILNQLNVSSQDHSVAKTTRPRMCKQKYQMGVRMGVFNIAILLPGCLQFWLPTSPVDDKAAAPSSHNHSIRTGKHAL